MWKLWCLKKVKGTLSRGTVSKRNLIQNKLLNIYYMLDTVRHTPISKGAESLSDLFTFASRWLIQSGHLIHICWMTNWMHEWMCLIAGIQQWVSPESLPWELAICWRRQMHRQAVSNRMKRDACKGSEDSGGRGWRIQSSRWVLKDIYKFSRQRRGKEEGIDPIKAYRGESVWHGSQTNSWVQLCVHTAMTMPFLPL